MAQVHAGRNEKFNEIWWLYCSSTAILPDRYVVFNYLENIWYYGTLTRSAWLDSQVRSYPIAAGLDGTLYLHDYGSDDTSVSPSVAIQSYIESADFDIGDGDSFAFVQRVIPDIDFIGSDNATPSVDFTVSVRNFPGRGTFTSSHTGATTGQEVTVQVYNYTDDMWLRLRGRQVAVKISCNTLGTKWKLGTPRLLVQPDGRKS
jgi:hypothetical protein